MRFAVVPIFVRGRMLDRKALPNVTPCIGELRLEFLMDYQRGRHLQFASLREDGMGLSQEILPNLHNPQIVGMSPLAFSLTGFERIGEIDYAQSWLVTEAPARKSSYDVVQAVRLRVAGMAV